MQRVRKGQIFVLLAPGFEESDVTQVTRTLRQAGFSVVLVGLTAGPVRGAYGMSLAPDRTLSEVEADLPQAIVLPGGIQGTRKFNADPRVHALLRQVVEQSGHIVTLDTAFTVLRSAGVLNREEEQQGREVGEQELSSRRVMVEGQVIFGQDSGTAQESALTLVALLGGGGWMERHGW